MKQEGRTAGNSAGRVETAVGREVHRYHEVPSTNDVALDLAAMGRPEGTIVVAESQKRGRGRRGRTWHSPPGRNLYLSILFRPQRDLREWQQLSWVVAGAVARTLRQCGLREGLLLKHPNDLLLKGRKISGVLLETRTGSGHSSCVVAGVGVNVNLAEEELPKELSGKATSLFMETGRSHDLEDVFRLLCGEVGELYSTWISHGETGARRLIEADGVAFVETSGGSAVVLSENRFNEEGST